MTEPEKIRKIQEKLKNGGGVLSYKKDELKYIQKPLGKAIYKNAINSPKIGRPKKKEEDKAYPNDRLICDLCKESYTRANRAQHRRSKIHQKVEKMNKKFLELLLDEDDE